MGQRRLRRSATRSVVFAAAALLAVGLAPAAASAAPTPAAHATFCHHQTYYRQLIGTVTAGTYLEASVPIAGTYAVEYDVTTANAASFDTYLNGTELGYVGGITGRYVTRAVQLTAGGQLVQVVGPEGSGSAQVYLVSVCVRHRK